MRVAKFLLKNSKSSCLPLLALITFFSVTTFACGNSRPSTLKLIVVDEKPSDSLGFTITIEGQTLEELKDNEFEFPLDPNLVAGKLLKLQIAETFNSSVDPFTGSRFDLWRVGSFEFLGTSLNSPLVLHIGDAVAWVNDGSWGRFEPDWDIPLSGRMSKLRMTFDSLNEFQNRFDEWKSYLEGRTIQGKGSYSIRCGLDFPWRLRSDGTFSFEFSEMELYFTKCSFYVRKLLPSQIFDKETLAQGPGVSKHFGWTEVLAILDEFEDDILELSDIYEREGRYLNSQSDFEKAMIYLEETNRKIDEELPDLYNVLQKVKLEISTVISQLEKEIEIYQKFGDLKCPTLKEC